MSSESLKSLIVTDPDLVDPELDVSGLKTQTDTDPRLLASIADFPGISYDPTEFSYLTDLNELFAYGLPVVDTGTTTPETGTGGGGTGDGGQEITPATPDIGGPVNTPEEQRLIDAGIGVQGAPGDPVVAPGEIPVTQDKLDAFNAPATLDSTSTAEDILKDLSNQQAMLNPTGGNIMDEVALTGTTPIEPGTFTADTLDQSFLSEEGLTENQNNTIKNILTAAGDNVQGALTQLGKIPGAIVDFANQTVDVFGKKLNVGATLAKFAINKAFGGPISLVFDIAKAVLPEESLANKTTRSIVDELKSENDYGFNMQSGNLNQDPFGRNPVSQFGDYEQTLKDDLLGINQSGFQTAEFLEKKQEFAKDYFDKKAEKAGGVEQTITTPDGKIVGTGDVLGPGEAPGDLVSLDDMLREQRDERIDAGIQAADDDKDSDMLDTATGVNPFADIDTGVGEFDTTPSDQNIIDRGGGDDIGTGGLDPNRGQQVDRGSSGAGDNEPVSTTTGPPSTGFQPQSTYDAELEDDRDVGGGGNDGGGDRKIVCTMMNESYGFGSFRNKIWMKFHKDLSPEYQRGYHKLFLPLVRIAKKNIIVKKVLEHIAVHSTIDMRQSMRGKTHLLGRVYRKILLPLCYWVGRHG